jgi:hypothetical protein
MVFLLSLRTPQDKARSIYQLLEIRPDRRSARVYTRGLKKLGGAWRAWYEWPDRADSDMRRLFYDFEFNR